MPTITPNILIYATLVLTIWSLYIGHRTRKHYRNLAAQKAAIAAGMTEPPSLHPVINHNRCLGCGSCVAACPEHPAHTVLGIINGKCHLVGPADCIGHGACKDVCPNDAITLVFGTENRGVDIPKVGEQLETNVPGIFIAGELGGMGLIHKAIEKGCLAMDSIRKLNGIGKGSHLDVAIVGAGPAGFAASLAAMEHKLRYVTLEQEDDLGGAVYHYPKGKLVMTRPGRLPLVGKTRFTETTKEKLLKYWKDVERKTGVKINYRESVETITPNAQGFEIKSSRQVYQARAVLLALGRRGTPRKLNVCGEDHCKVVYRLIDPEEHRSKCVLVVGGGDSALEAATSIAALPKTSVILSYRSKAFARAKEKNRQKVMEAEQSGCLKVLMKSNVKEITPTHVHIEQEGQVMEFENDAIIVCAGGILPTGFLKKTGIIVETKYGTP